MGESATAAATLPPLDPDLDRPLEAGGPADANADDLIAELAGEQIDKLLAESGVAPAARAVATVVPPQPVPPIVAEPVPLTPAAAASSTVETASVTAAELDAVLSEAAARIAASDAAPAPHAAAVASPAVSPPGAAVVPLFLKPLVWANAPLAACPERVREAVGKIALITFVNALGVLAYTLAFHRPR